jgi:predicted MFS family arabinose efflux permease
VAVPAVISQQYPDQNEMYQGYAVMAMGLGLTIGPVFGAIVFELVSFANGMFIFAAIVFATGQYAVSKMSDKLD